MFIQCPSCNTYYDMEEQGWINRSTLVQCEKCEGPFQIEIVNSISSDDHSENRKTIDSNENCPHENVKHQVMREEPFQERSIQDVSNREKLQSIEKMSEKAFSRFTIKEALVDIVRKSSLKKELFGKLYHHHREVFIVFVFAFIPFLSLNLSVDYQKVFFPVYVGVLWAFIVFSYFGDGKCPIKPAILVFLFAGIVSTNIAVVVSEIADKLLGSFPAVFYNIIGVGAVEEYAKIIPILWLISKNHKHSIALRYIDILVLSIICGIAFSAIENINYKAIIDNLIGRLWFWDIELSGLSNIHFLRAMSLPILHGSWSAILGFISYHGAQFGDGRRYMLSGLAISGTLHGLYNTLTHQYYVSTIIIVVVSFSTVLVFYCLSIYMDRMNQSGKDK